jgi:hypothetical protein
MFQGIDSKAAKVPNDSAVYRQSVNIERTGWEISPSVGSTIPCAK